MKRKLPYITSMSAASLLAFSALAQETLDPRTAETFSTHQPMTQARSERLNDASKITDIIGMTVNNYQNEKLGRVEDLAVDVEVGMHLSRRPLFHRGISRHGQCVTAVPPGALHYDVAENVFIPTPARRGLRRPSSLTPREMGTLNTPVRIGVTQVHGHSVKRSYFVADNEGYRNVSR